jgi:MFS superfamily sulfate permease-like transporter
MITNFKNNFVSNIKKDIPASIIVFFVALPLCLGIALASGAPLFSGVISGIVGGIIVGVLSGSSLGVSGPAAGLTAIILAAIATLGSYQDFLMAVVISGVLQILFGILKFGIIGYYFPTSVIKGMLSGIGIIIILKQIPHFLGWTYQSDFSFNYNIFNIDQQFDLANYFLNNISFGSSTIALVSLFTIIYWDNILSKKHQIFKLIQGPIIAVVLGISYQIIFGSNETFGIDKFHLVNVPAPSDYNLWINELTFPNFNVIYNSNVWLIAFTIAIVASLETLLSVEATDKLDPIKRTTPTNRELFAQGVGNITSGLIGGLPITQVIVRSSANIQSGGKSKISTIIHGFLLLISVIFIPNILNLIPLSVLASILIIVGYKLSKPKIFKDIYKLGKSQYLPFTITVLVIVFKDLLWGIGIGFALSIFNVLYKSYKNSYILNINKSETEIGVISITLAEELSFFNKAAIIRELDAIAYNTILELDIRNNKYIDYDVIEVFENFIIKAKERNIEIKLFTANGEVINPESFIPFLEKKRYKYSIK